MKTQEPDFEVRKLSEYSVEDLDQLLRATRSAFNQAKEWGRLDDAEALDIWTYRIRDAKKIAEQLI